MLVSNIDWDDYVGRVAIGRITSGTVKKGIPYGFTRATAPAFPAR